MVLSELIIIYCYSPLFRMNISEAYRQWAPQYDTDTNHTRDLERIAFREMLSGTKPERVLELGCGTGKNTEWLAGQAEEITAVDLSPEMLARARQKVRGDNVKFVQANILEPWHFATQAYHLVSFSLVLEHIEDLNAIIRKVSKVLRPGGLLYIGELHPYRQYRGSQARFSTKDGEQSVPAFTHHLSDYLQAVNEAGFQLHTLKEYFDEEKGAAPPRILALLFKRK